VAAPHLKVKVERMQERLRDPPADLSGIAQVLKSLAPPESRYIKWLTVPHGSDLRVIAVTEICYLRADNKYTTLATPHGTFLMNATLKQLKDKLDPDVFWQIHRSVVVNVGAIDTIYRSFRGSLEVKLKERSEVLPVSAAHAHLFRESARR
jgi:DNA-binding LytR/AlgR family response regulator